MRKTKWLVSLFIFAYIFSTALSLLPVSPLRNALFDPIRPIILYTGLWQNFVLFAPEPPKSNIDITAKVTKKNGQTVDWQYPRMDKLSFFDRIEKERYRSFGNDYTNYYEVFRPDLARYIARLHRDQQNPPRTIEIERHWADIPSPGANIDKAAPAHDKHSIIFTYAVQPSDLK